MLNVMNAFSNVSLEMNVAFFCGVYRLCPVEHNLGVGMGFFFGVWEYPIEIRSKSEVN